MDLPIPAGPHLLSLYLVDWDWYAGEHPRMETVLLHGEKMEPIVLSTGKFGGGYYERLLVKGPKKLSLRISKHRSPCVVVSGIFLDKVAPPQPVPQRGDTTAGVSIRAMPERPVELCLMANRFAVLTAAYERDPLGAIQSPEWAAFESDCAALAAKPNPSGHVLWWLAECQRVRADFAASQKSLVACLQRMSMEMPPDQRKKFLTGLARRMATFGYRPEASLAALQEAARTDPEDPRGRMEEFLRRYHGGGVFHAAAQWVKMNPLPTRIQDRDDER
jgi:hypothetical protein